MYYDRIICVLQDMIKGGKMPQVELLTVANHAEAVNGLLYLSGAGWTDHRRPIAPGGSLPITHFGVAIAILVGWEETNRRHRVVLRMENADGQEMLNMQADMEMGRPPGLPPGSDLRGVMAINADMQFPSAGIYRLIAAVADSERSVTFRVHDVPVPPAPEQSQRG
jgi:hypothetical protein